jgi:hypothetical protein
MKNTFSILRKQACRTAVFGPQQSVAAALVVPSNRTFAIQAKPTSSFFGVPARTFASKRIFSNIF